MPDVLIQTVLPPSIAEWAKSRAAAEGVSVAAWLRRLVMQRQQAVTIKAWAALLKTGAPLNGPHDLVFERMPTEPSGLTPFRVWEHDGARPCRVAWLGGDLLPSMRLHGVRLEGSPEPWRIVNEFADNGADGQLVLLMREDDSMSRPARAAMGHVMNAYEREGFPEDRAFDFPYAPAADELRALGLFVEVTRNPGAVSMKLTDEGRRWIMTHRVH